MSNLKKMFLSIVNKQMSHEDLGMFNLVKKKKKTFFLQEWGGEAEASHSM